MTSDPAVDLRALARDAVAARLAAASSAAEPAALYEAAMREVLDAVFAGLAEARGLLSAPALGTPSLPRRGQGEVLAAGSAA
ncbi:MAG: hypothetical protein HYU66_08940, partial [Armatimonadetes bacterium]|nr:hypothetical protein [Armatimonadota bacterium]